MIVTRVYRGARQEIYSAHPGLSSMQGLCTHYATAPWRKLTAVPAAAPSRSQRQHRAVTAAQAVTATAADARVEQATKSLGPYLLWDKALQLRAVFDSRSCSKADIDAATQLLEQHALDAVVVNHSQGSKGEQLTAMTLTCSPAAGDRITAALLQLTPATHVSATPCELCSLPEHKVQVTTPYGPVDLRLSLAGSKVCKVTPDWQQCQEAAAAAAAEMPKHAERNGQGRTAGVDAAAVAVAAVQQLQAGLEDGSVELGMHMYF